MTEFSIGELCACARREVALRKRVYPRWVCEERMEAQEAAHQIAMMEAIADLLESQQQPKLL